MAGGAAAAAEMAISARIARAIPAPMTHGLRRNAPIPAIAPPAMRMGSKAQQATMSSAAPAPRSRPLPPGRSSWLDIIGVLIPFSGYGSAAAVAVVGRGGRLEAVEQAGGEGGPDPARLGHRDHLRAGVLGQPARGVLGEVK